MGLLVERSAEKRRRGASSRVSLLQRVRNGGVSWVAERGSARRTRDVGEREGRGAAKLDGGPVSRDCGDDRVWNGDQQSGQRGRVESRTTSDWWCTGICRTRCTITTR